MIDVAEIPFERLTEAVHRVLLHHRPGVAARAAPIAAVLAKYGESISAEASEEEKSIRSQLNRDLRAHRRRAQRRPHAPRTKAGLDAEAIERRDDALVRQQEKLAAAGDPSWGALDVEYELWKLENERRSDWIIFRHDVLGEMAITPEQGYFTPEQLRLVLCLELLRDPGVGTASETYEALTVKLGYEAPSTPRSWERQYHRAVATNMPPLRCELRELLAKAKGGVFVAYAAIAEKLQSRTVVVPMSVADSMAKLRIP